MYLKYCIIIAPWVSIWFQPPSMQGPLCKAAGGVHMAHAQPPGSFKAPLHCS